MWHLSYLRHACALDVHNHTHMLCIHTKYRQELHCWVGIMLLKTQLSGEKPQTERGDTVRNVYKAAWGRMAEDQQTPRALCGLRKKARQRLVLDDKDLKFNLTLKF